MRLRAYQEAAVNAVWNHLRGKETNPVVVLPTAAGKSLVLATLAAEAVKRWNGRVIILAHVKELLSQNARHLQELAPDVAFGIYSAGLGSRGMGYPVTVAGIQSVYQRAEEFGKVDLVIQDEVHLTPPDGEGTYRTLLQDLKAINPAIRLVGLTATPFRMTTGMIFKPENLYQEICYSVGIRELIRDGYLSKLKSKGGTIEPDLSKVHVRGGEFIAGELEEAMNDEQLVALAVGDMIGRAKDRHSAIVFASGIAHGNRIASLLAEEGESVECVYGETPSEDRDSAIRDFKAGKIRWLVNVNVLSTGFDAPNCDCIVLLRPTLSPGLYYQQVGRGFRIHPSKENTLILDFSGNILRHGPVDAIRIEERKGNGIGEAPAKKCPECMEIVAAGYATCPECGYLFPPRELKHLARAQDGSILSGEPESFDVKFVKYFRHWKRDDWEKPDAITTLRVEYHNDVANFNEWICLEHKGFARTKAAKWWTTRSKAPMPASVKEAVELARNGMLLEPSRIWVRSEGKYMRVVRHEDFHERPKEQLAEKIVEKKPVETDLTSAQEDIGF